ncbi:MAG: SDR family NAD(P)-dependent oxidoreductase [Granulosicoccaceae bacterium]
MTFDLNGKSALITGASSGLGVHFSQVLGRAGAKVVLAARREEALASHVAALREQEIDAYAVTMDVSDRDSVDAAVSNANALVGGIDVLVNNAGIADNQRFLEMSEESWQRVLDVDLSGVFRVGQAVARLMAEQGRGGAIVNIASVLGLVVQPTQANYCTAKAGVIQLTKVMARELWRDNIRVNCIAPGYFKTEINAEFFDSEAGAEYAKRLFPKRIGRLDELDGPLLLLSSDAGSYMTGVTLPVDGGTLLSRV